jgi:uroporphyrin-3 C-methyltransferase
LPTLAMRLDEVVRMVDELPLLSAPQRGAAKQAARPVQPAASPASGGDAAPDPAWIDLVGARWAALGAQIWDEVRRLVRVTPVAQPEAALLAPEQAFFLRENLKLRLLNARLALLSRQFDTAQADLRDALSALERYFDRSSRRTTSAIDLVRQVSTQARQITIPRPDATLAAIATVTGGR